MKVRRYGDFFFFKTMRRMTTQFGIYGRDYALNPQCGSGKPCADLTVGLNPCLGQTKIEKVT
jgi:hypothetical protein